MFPASGLISVPRSDLLAEFLDGHGGFAGWSALWSGYASELVYETAGMHPATMSTAGASGQAQTLLGQRAPLPNDTTGIETAPFHLEEDALRSRGSFA